MKRKLIVPLLACVLLLSACGEEQQVEEEIVFGDIDTTIEYIKSDFQAPSAVERKKEVDINDTFLKISLNETEEKKSGTLPTVAGDNYAIERVQLNGVYFDINQIANKTDYSMSINNGVATLTIPHEDGSIITASVAQIADESFFTEDKGINEDEFEELLDIVNEYSAVYEETENQTSNEYGNYYTYAKYVDWLNAHENAKFDISMYSQEQILDLALEVLGIDKPADDFYINTSADLLEVSDWYQIKMSFRYEKENEQTIEISVKSSGDGIFLFMTKYDAGANIDENGNIYFTPTMIINIAQNNYYQLAESSKSVNNRENYQNGFR